MKFTGKIVLFFTILKKLKKVLIFVREKTEGYNLSSSMIARVGSISASAAYHLSASPTFTEASELSLQAVSSEGISFLPKNAFKPWGIPVVH